MKHWCATNTVKGARNAFNKLATPRSTGRRNTNFSTGVRAGRFARALGSGMPLPDGCCADAR